MNHLPTHILKFGGSSLQNEDFIKQSAQIVIDRAKTVRPVVVVSAIGNTTDSLINIANNPVKAPALIAKLERQHCEFFSRFTSPSNGQKVILQSLFGELRQLIQNLPFCEWGYGAWRDHILSIGERASALILASALSKQDIRAKACEAHHFIKTDSNFGQAGVKSELSRKLIRKQLQELEEIPIITGFIGSDEQDRITTLGRSGSDYTAGLLADALNADHLEIWTDVNGVLTADPRWVPTAEPIEELSFSDIGELSAHGANVIHPKTISPIGDQDTSVLVKNSYNPSHSGTLIKKSYKSNGAFKTITTTGPFVHLSVDDTHAHDLLGKLNRWLGEEPDSEAFSFTRSSSYEPARFLIRQSLFSSMRNPLADWAKKRGISLNAKHDIYKVKKFSNRFHADEHLTERIWNLLAAKNLRPLHVERNRDERFISFLFNQEEARRAARLLNDYLQHSKTTADLFLAGTGAVGRTLLEQLKNFRDDDLNIRLLGTCNSRKVCWDDQGLDLNKKLDWSNAEDTNWNNLLKKLSEPHRHNVIFVDATGSEQVARLYPKLFKAGIHVVTPSKLANTFEQSFFDLLQAKTQKHDASFRYETTVGAGLPVISTIQNLQQSGDSITKISGVVSGTMTYLFNQLAQGVSFSEAIIDAREIGYAEPDPRDDLSGEDVARKFLTLARTLGYSIERDELNVESLIPNKLASVDRNTFLAKLSGVDNYWKERTQKAKEKNEVLCYTGTFKEGQITIGIESVAKNSPVGQLKGTDNLFQIYSKFYDQTPLVIQGPGAGKEVTAAGVLGDVLKTSYSFD